MKPRPLPHDLRNSPFTVSTAAGRGVTRNRLRASDLHASVWGVRSTTPPQNLVDRCRLFATRLSTDAFFSHSTAALLLGAPLPLGLEMSTDLHIALPAPARAPHATGIRGHRLTLADGDLADIHELHITSAARTWCDLASRLSLVDLVAVGDHLIHHRLPLTSVEELTAALVRHPGRRGQANGRAAIPLLDDGAESRPESVFRVIAVLGGLPHPLVNHRIVLTEDGQAVRPDFEFTPYRVLVEYQGDYHRTKEQWRKDLTRRSRLEAQGWVVVEINADDLKDPHELLERIGAFLRRQGWDGR